MSIIVVGLNHKTAPIELRERFAFSQKEIECALSTLSRTLFCEAVILSTCNRVEIYADGASGEDIIRWFCSQKELVLNEELLSHLYILNGIEAAEHLMRVACGLDSLVLGEAEILGQVKSAFSLACLYKTVGDQLSRLFRQTFHVAKQIRSSTKIGACPVSVASTAVKYVSTWWNSAHRVSPRILIIGVGNVGRIVAKHAQSCTTHPMFIMSRNLKNAQRLAEEVRGMAIDIAKLPEYLHQVDVVISATSSKTILISDDMVTRITQSLLMLDLAVPRDISPTVNKNPYVHLCQLDQLKVIIQEHVHVRSHAAAQAEKLIMENAREFMLSLRKMNSNEIIKRYRANMEKYCEYELQKVLQHNASEEKTAMLLKNFSRNLLNKIMHLPSVQLQQASIEGRDEVLRYASEIFGIEGSTQQ